VDVRVLKSDDALLTEAAVEVRAEAIS